MAFKYTIPDARSANAAGGALDNLANGSESADITLNNSSTCNLYVLVTIKLGSITPSTGGSISLRVRENDGTDTADKVGGDIFPLQLLSGTGAKIVMKKILISPFSLRLSIINNSGVALAASGNEIYFRSYNEDQA